MYKYEDLIQLGKESDPSE